MPIGPNESIRTTMRIHPIPRANHRRRPRMTPCLHILRNAVDTAAVTESAYQIEITDGPFQVSRKGPSSLLVGLSPSPEVSTAFRTHATIEAHGCRGHLGDTLCLSLYHTLEEEKQ